LGREVSSFSYDSKDKYVLELADNIGKRESKSRSEIIMDGLKHEVISHGRGNSQFSLEISSQPDFVALPTIGEPLTPKFANMPRDEFDLIGQCLRSRLQEHEHEEKKLNLQQRMREAGKI